MGRFNQNPFDLHIVKPNLRHWRKCQNRHAATRYKEYGKLLAAESTKRCCYCEQPAVPYTERCEGHQNRPIPDHLAF